MTTAVRFDLLLDGLHAATMRDGVGYAVIHDAAIGVRGDRIAWIGPLRDLPRGAAVARRVSCGGRWATPGLIDCHTHLVYAGNRAQEFEQRLHGASYADIARTGGGIQSTLRATRAATQDALAEQSAPRLAALVAEGVTTIEIKSGYGQDTATELKQLKIARRLAAECAVDVRTTLLAAHVMPPEFVDRQDAYIHYVCREMIPAVAAAEAADAVDAFCESIAFTPTQTKRVFDCAREHRLPVKLHADQLSDLNGAELAAQYGALSADHLEHTSERGVQAMAKAGTIAVLLPGAFYSLRETRLPPIDALRARSVPIAIASDCNPGTSPTVSLVLMLNMACTLFRLTPEEALAGVTRHAARALGLADRGTLSIGQRADIALWDIDNPAELAYRLGGNACAGVVRSGTLQRMSF